MCIFKACPLFATCEKEVEQVLYCRHVEMLKKIGKLRLEMRRANNSTAPNAPIPLLQQPLSELLTTKQRPPIDQTH